MSSPANPLGHNEPSCSSADPDFAWLPPLCCFGGYRRLESSLSCENGLPRAPGSACGEQAVLFVREPPHKEAHQKNVYLSGLDQNTTRMTRMCSPATCSFTCEVHKAPEERHKPEAESNKAVMRRRGTLFHTVIIHIILHFLKYKFLGHFMHAKYIRDRKP